MKIIIFYFQYAFPASCVTQSQTQTDAHAGIADHYEPDNQCKGDDLTDPDRDNLPDQNDPSQSEAAFLSDPDRDNLPDQNDPSQSEAAFLSDPDRDNLPDQDDPSQSEAAFLSDPDRDHLPDQDDPSQSEAALLSEIMHALHVAEFDRPYYDYDTFEASASTVYEEPGISMIVSDSATNTDMDMSVDELDEINESFELFTVNDNNIQSTSSMPVQFGFKKNIIPELLYRHPPPYSGRDDDPAKLREIADDLRTMLGYNDHSSQGKDKVLFGPDHKIGKNLLELMKRNDRYEMFLPEFPCLHLRKSRITIFLSAYKNAGLMQLLQYMRDDDSSDWVKLSTVTHIDVATRNISRLAHAFHAAFLWKFWVDLPETMKNEFAHDRQSLSPLSISEKWDEEYQVYLDKHSQGNATFALHCDMMAQMDDIMAIKLAERLGGDDGYHLLLATSKSSLPFSFVNGATAYSPYCIQLLYEHFRAGPFHQKLKKTLFSTPHPDSIVNMACDTKREIDHQDVTKSFRSASTMPSVMRRMCLVDRLGEVKNMRSMSKQKKDDDDDHLGWNVSSMDIRHIQQWLR